jgi:hypothetical protein
MLEIKCRGDECYEIIISAGIFKQTMGGYRNRVGIGLSYRPTRARIFKILRSPGIDSKEPIPPGCVAPEIVQKFQHRLYRLAEKIPWVRLLGFLKI